MMDNKPQRWLKVVGIGEDGLEGISTAAKKLVESAEVLFGGKRHLEMVPDGKAEKIIWAKRMREAVPKILERRGQNIVVLASGDPMCYGIGTKLLRHLELGEVEIHPVLNSFSLACSRMGWSLPDVETMTIHGRPVTMLHPYLYPGARILCLSEDASSPAEAASLLHSRGFGSSRITVLENMGGAKEKIYCGEAHSWNFPEGSSLNTLAIECFDEPNPDLLSRIAGLPESAFQHDGKLTKQEVRSTVLSKLMPFPEHLLWDIGAGCGSIAIEWMRSHPNCHAVAVERSSERINMIRNNADALGTPMLQTVQGEVPGIITELPRPDAVFLGGGISFETLEKCWEALAPLGRLVSNAVTLESERVLLDWQARQGGELTRISISRAESVGSFQGWRPLMPVTQFSMVKR
ncbi:MAG TPA: precorrin-6y C5,15-methyltransferase (decarboxylating) subunit CbiE [SAR324 cluster bacterium]|jgi:precorrin-6Y C5,15-methyltransferase (decarboxylating)|nr:precorrin-6y C5,15-methyltransferase (decarboxylating) subunit CbiE [Deltaproteobacteria bacterium]HJM06451.1 precorrin-6y C5,15-methyltransferase (decarboxylating) subunit CbiE [SAR324 cluster bacterium]HJO43699.1 precorrin-6y C5,15-methyltransferase (decarboxylating) subunit CbiE [SAR324 cluster bacterium]|tara:strand:- start:8403 stop:9620 length:1218 start_codon:yes stop_codon:yes gene_type:complete